MLEYKIIIDDDGDMNVLNEDGNLVSMGDEIYEYVVFKKALFDIVLILSVGNDTSTRNTSNAINSIILPKKKVKAVWIIPPTRAIYFLLKTVILT